jgi:peptide subunit release factor 1 (eRF1)
MISYDDIRELQQYQPAGDSLVLSLYVDVDQSKSSNLNRGFETTVENLLRTIGEGPTTHASHLNAERKRVLNFIREYVPHGKSLVLFSDSSRELWWQRDLQVELPTEARFSSKPWLRPLLDVVEESDRFAAVLIDKQRARILTIDASGADQRAELVSDVPSRHMTTGTDHIWSQGQMERDHDNHMRAHARRAATEVTSLMDRFKLSSLVVGGPVEATTVFVSELPKRIQQMIIGTASVSLDIPDDRLYAELRQIQQRSEHDDEARLVDSLITAAKKRDRAVLGVTDTLRAIQEGRVYRLVVATGFRATHGQQCNSCGVLTADGAGDECSFCGARLEAAPDLVNRASHRVLEQAGKVSMVSGEAAAKLAGDGIGAILRF